MKYIAIVFLYLAAHPLVLAEYNLCSKDGIDRLISTNPVTKQELGLKAAVLAAHERRMDVAAIYYKKMVAIYPEFRNEAEAHQWSIGQLFVALEKCKKLNSK